MIQPRARYTAAEVAGEATIGRHMLALARAENHAPQPIPTIFERRSPTGSRQAAFLRLLARHPFGLPVSRSVIVEVGYPGYEFHDMLARLKRRGLVRTEMTEMKTPLVAHLTARGRRELERS